MLIRREVIPNGFVTISDEDAYIKEALNKNEAVIGIWSPNTVNRDWSKVSYLIEDWEDIDETFLKEVYCRHHGIPLMIAETKRLRIREMKESDLDALYRLYKDEAASKFLEKLDTNRHVELEKIRAYIRNVYSFYGCGIWMIEDASNNNHTIIGRVGLEPETYHNNLAWFLGYLIDKPYRKKGLCIEACELAISYVNERLDLTEIYCKVQNCNETSHHIAKMLGFVPFEKELDSIIYKRNL